MFKSGRLANLFHNTLDVWVDTNNYLNPTWKLVQCSKDINLTISAEEADVSTRCFNHVATFPVLTRVEFDTEVVLKEDTTEYAWYLNLRQKVLNLEPQHMAISDQPAMTSGANYLQAVWLVELTERHRHNDVVVVEIRGKLAPYPIAPSVVTVP